MNTFYIGIDIIVFSAGMILFGLKMGLYLRKGNLEIHRPLILWFALFSAAVGMSALCNGIYRENPGLLWLDALGRGVLALVSIGAVIATSVAAKVV